MRSLLRVAALLLIVNGCGGSDNDVTDPDDINLPNGSMSARIDGSSWNARTAISAQYRQGILAVAGTDNTTTIGFAIAGTGPGTYAIGATSAANALMTAGSAGFTAVGTTGSGSITVNTLTANSASGTFQFVLVASSGATGTRTITNGTFNVTY